MKFLEHTHRLGIAIQWYTEACLARPTSTPAAFHSTHRRCGPPPSLFCSVFSCHSRTFLAATGPSRKNRYSTERDQRSPCGLRHKCFVHGAWGHASNRAWDRHCSASLLPLSRHPVPWPFGPVSSYVNPLLSRYPERRREEGCAIRARIRRYVDRVDKVSTNPSADCNAMHSKSLLLPGRASLEESDDNPVGANEFSRQAIPSARASNDNHLYKLALYTRARIPAEGDFETAGGFRGMAAAWRLTARSHYFRSTQVDRRKTRTLRRSLHDCQK